VGVRLRYGGDIQAFECGGEELGLGTWVVVRHGDVVRIGMVTTAPVILPPSGPPVYLPSDRELLRAATADDLARQSENMALEAEQSEFCRQRARRLGLPMKLVTTEITFDNYKSVFYYTSDERVDFRQLVKDLVRKLRNRVEMRQISVRHEAMMLGGMGVCGRALCCSTFLKNFSPVSVRMAKEQRLSINTVKISGLCGRLMCCLAFEGKARPQGSQRGGAPCGGRHPLLGEDLWDEYEETGVVDGPGEDDPAWAQDGGEAGGPGDGAGGPGGDDPDALEGDGPGEGRGDGDGPEDPGSIPF
jgi:cell fate regulator YaaT (PSP1 superfamily)